MFDAHIPQKSNHIYVYIKNIVKKHSTERFETKHTGQRSSFVPFPCIFVLVFLCMRFECQLCFETLQVRKITCILAHVDI